MDASRASVATDQRRKTFGGQTPSFHVQSCVSINKVWTIGDTVQSPSLLHERNVPVYQLHPLKWHRRRDI